MDSPAPEIVAPEPATGELPALPQVVPAVVLVMVTCDPGPWLEEALDSVAAQTYPDLSVLVVDNASADDPTDRVRARLPMAHVQRMEADLGFGAAANQVMELVEGAAFYAFCHDDVALDADALRSLVEEAFRSNAGIIGPKVVEWDDPARILQVGMTADKIGVAAPLAEPGELDQQQHDAVRDVFVIPGAVTLVRADLFAALGGYDAVIDHCGDDLDLCWRAHLVGARVMVAPTARVRHRQAFDQRFADRRSRRRLSRHRLRTVLVTYGFWQRIRVLPQAIVYSMIEAVVAIVSGRPDRARDVASAWTWNLRRAGDVRRRRRSLQSTRSVGDSEIRAMQARGSARVGAAIRHRSAEREDGLAARAQSSRDLAGSLRAGSRQVTGAFAVVLGLVLLVSSRDLITGGVPVIGEFARFPDAPRDLLSAWFSGWRRAGLGGAGAQPTAYGLLGLAGYLSFGAMGALRSLLILGTVPVGALGAWRLAAPVGSVRASVAALAVYLALPVPYNALATGSWSGLAVYAIAPWVLLALGNASGLAPFGPGVAETGERGTSRPRRRLVPIICGLGLALGIIAAFVPLVIPMVVVVTVALALGGVLCFRVAGVARLIIAGLGASLIAVALNVVWFVEILSGPSPWSSVAGRPSAGVQSFDLGQILRFESGPWGAPPLGWAFLGAAALPVVIGRSWRLEWAVRSWLVVLAGWALLWASGSGEIDLALPSAEVVLAPVAAALALTAALGLAAFESDLRAYRFGWRQVLSVVAAVGVVIGALPLASGLLDGRWKTPERDFASSLEPLIAADGVPTRVLYLASPDVAPVGTWRYDDAVAYGASDRAVVTVLDRFVGPPPGPSNLLADAVRLAETDRTNRLGHLLAPMGVHYIVVTGQLAPVGADQDAGTPPPAVVETLGQQLDLQEIPVRDGVTVFRNMAWAPARAVFADGLGERTSFTEAVADDLTDGRVVLAEDRGAVGATGTIAETGAVLAGTAANENWRLRIDGVPMARSTAYGWANQFTATRTGDATLTYDTPFTRKAAAIGQVTLWILVIAVRRRSRRGERRAIDDAPAPTGARRSVDPSENLGPVLIDEDRA